MGGGRCAQGYVLLGVHFGGVVGIRREGVGVSVQWAGGRGEGRGYCRRWQGGVSTKVGYVPLGVPRYGCPRVSARLLSPAVGGHYLERHIHSTSAAVGMTDEDSHTSDTAPNASRQLWQTCSSWHVPVSPLSRDGSLSMPAFTAECHASESGSVSRSVESGSAEWRSWIIHLWILNALACAS